MTFRTVLAMGATLGFTAVVAGTFGAHGLEGRIAEDLLATYETGARYHAYHALAVLACAAFIERLGKPGGAAVWCFTIGTIIFAGTLYALALTGHRWLGALTPIGGVFLLVGWVLLLVGAMRSTESATVR